jgi:mRNA-degrading endonuclease RelE of RelBE toxin-antitoxin system
VSLFELQTTQNFVRDVRDLDVQTKKRLDNKLKNMRSLGMPNDVDAVHCAPGCFRTKVGDYRLVFRFQESTFQLVFFCPRKDVYERLKRRLA